MARDIRAATEDDLRFLAEAVEYVPTENFRGVVLWSGGQRRVVVGYDNWTDGSVTIHQWIESPRWMGRDILHEAFRYPFEIGGKQVVIGVVRSDNPEALLLDSKLGFRTRGIIPDAYGPGVDMHILSMSKHECRW